MRFAAAAAIAGGVLWAGMALAQPVLLIPPAWSAGDEWRELVDAGVVRYGWSDGGRIDLRDGAPPATGLLPAGRRPEGGGDVFVLVFSRRSGLSLRAQGAEVRRAAALVRATRGEPEDSAIILVGYSTGGLAARAASCFYSGGAIAGIVTMATPNAGTPIAFLAPTAKWQGLSPEEACRCLVRPGKGPRRPPDSAEKEACDAETRRVNELLARTGLPAIGSDEMARLHPLGAELLELNREPVPESVAMANVVYAIPRDLPADDPRVQLGEVIARLGRAFSGSSTSELPPNDGFVPVDSQFLRRVGLPPYVNASLLHRRIWSGSVYGSHGTPGRGSNDGGATPSPEILFEALQSVGWHPPPKRPPPDSTIGTKTPGETKGRTVERSEGEGAATPVALEPPPKSVIEVAAKDAGRVTRVTGQFLTISWGSSTTPPAGVELQIRRRRALVARAMLLGGVGRLLDAEVLEEEQGASARVGDEVSRVGGVKLQARP